MKKYYAIFLFSMFALTGFSVHGQSIKKMGNGIKSLYITGLFYDNDVSKLYACGYFQDNGGNPYRHILAWDGSAWQPLGDGVTNPGFADHGSAMIKYKGKLILGGGFDEMDNLPANNVAEWDGIEWKELGGGIDYIPSCFAIYKDTLYMGVSRLMDGGNVACLFKLNGNQWDSVGQFKMSLASLSMGGIKDMKVWNNKLYIAGNFDGINGIPASSVATWDGQNWGLFGSDVIYGTVESMEMYKNELYIGGDFTNINTTPVQYFAKWNGTSWSGISTGMNQEINALATFGDHLAIGGIFTMVNSVSSRYLTLYNGNSFVPFDAQDNVYTLLAKGDTLFVAGDLDSLNKVFVNNIAMVIFPSPAGVSETGKHNTIKMYPNPAKDKLYINAEDATIQITDVTGKQLILASITNNKKYVDVSVLPGGSYFIKAVVGDKEESSILVIQR